MNDNKDHIQHLLHDPIVREIQSLMTADFQTTINQEMLYQLVASLKLKEARIVLQQIIGIQSIKSMKNAFSKWSNVTRECNSKLMDSDKVSGVNMYATRVTLLIVIFSYVFSFEWYFNVPQLLRERLLKIIDTAF